MSSKSGFAYLKSTLSLLVVIPFLFNSVILFALIIIGLFIYLYLKNKKERVHLFYSITLGVSMFTIDQLHDIMDLIKTAGHIVSEANSLEDFSSYDLEGLISTVKSIIDKASSYKVLIIIILALTIAC